jgi:hypothetical protein
LPRRDADVTPEFYKNHRSGAGRFLPRWGRRATTPARQPVLECGSLLPLSKAAASRRTPNRLAVQDAANPAV